LQLILEQQRAVKENLANAEAFVQESVEIRCDSLIEDLQQLNECHHKEIDRTETEICE